MSSSESAFGRFITEKDSGEVLREAVAKRTGCPSGDDSGEVCSDLRVGPAFAIASAVSSRDPYISSSSESLSARLKEDEERRGVGR
jgi:hypothetical protein